MHAKSVYVGCALLIANDIYKSFINAFITVLETKLPVNRFYSFPLESKEGDNIFVFDEQQVLVSDALVAFVDYPSTGLGMEIMIAHRARKDIVFVVNSKNKISGMLEGLIKKYHYPVVYYSNQTPIHDLSKEVLKALE